MEEEDKDERDFYKSIDEEYQAVEEGKKLNKISYENYLINLPLELNKAYRNELDSPTIIKIGLLERSIMKIAYARLDIKPKLRMGNFDTQMKFYDSYHSLNDLNQYFFDELKKIDPQKSEKLQNEIQKNTKSLLFNGRELNLAERFKIANGILNIDQELRKLNISDREKYRLVSYILGCNETNARHLMNNQYPAKIREELIQSFINRMKQEN